MLGWREVGFSGRASFISVGRYWKGYRVYVVPASEATCSL